jgi:hypothetical protein
MLPATAPSPCCRFSRVIVNRIRFCSANRLGLTRFSTRKAYFLNRDIQISNNSRGCGNVYISPPALRIPCSRNHLRALPPVWRTSVGNPGCPQPVHVPTAPGRTPQVVPTLSTPVVHAAPRRRYGVRATLSSSVPSVPFRRAERRKGKRRGSGVSPAGGGRAARAVGNDTTVANGVEPPARPVPCRFRHGGRAPVSRPCGRASLTQRRSRAPARLRLHPHPRPPPNPLPSPGLPVREGGLRVVVAANSFAFAAVPTPVLSYPRTPYCPSTPAANPAARPRAGGRRGPSPCPPPPWPPSGSRSSGRARRTACRSPPAPGRTSP